MRIQNQVSSMWKPPRIPHDLLCPITHAAFRQPVLCADGFCYEKKAILKWFGDHKPCRSPMTNEAMVDRSYPENNVRELAADFRQSYLNSFLAWKGGQTGLSDRELMVSLEQLVEVVDPAECRCVLSHDEVCGLSDLQTEASVSFLRSAGLFCGLCGVSRSCVKRMCIDCAWKVFYLARTFECDVCHSQRNNCGCRNCGALDVVVNAVLYVECGRGKRAEACEGGRIKIVYGMETVEEEHESVVNLVLTFAWSEVYLVTAGGDERLAEAFKTAVFSLGAFSKTAIVV